MMMNTIRTITLFSVLALLVLCTSFPASAAGDPFAEGSVRMSVILGSGYAFNESYTVFGVGAGYFVAKGLELALDGESWSGGTPGITKVSPGLRYVFSAKSSMRPYLGAFYRRTAIENYKDLDSYGGRAGLYFLFGQGGYFGLGGVYEKYLSCNESVYRSCTESYPELIFAIAL